MKTAAILLPATFPDAMQPGEYHRSERGVSICCVSCGVVQPLVDPELIWSCENPACTVSLWLELADNR